MKMPGGRAGTIGGGGAIIVILALLAKAYLGIDIGVGGGGGGGGPPSTQRSRVGSAESGAIETSPEEEKLVDFISVVLDDLQATWREELGRTGAAYQDAKLVLYREGTESGCGFGSKAVGPFYCPADGKVYIDLSFYAELDRRFGAPGDFAQAYVLAHEVGHHIQNLLGIDREVRQRASRDNENELSVRQELQADCFAGVWGYHAKQKGMLEAGDVEEGLAAAAAIGDDTLQKQAGVQVSPESWTHGSSAQRVRWFRRGFDSGNITECDTFTIEKP
jgi:predicted metalloprotease